MRNGARLSDSQLPALSLGARSVHNPPQPELALTTLKGCGRGQANCPSGVRTSLRTQMLS